MKLNKEIKFNWHLVEAYSRGLQFALLDEKGNIRNKPIRCKDYIQDVYWSELTGQGEVEQYGFKWNGKNKNPISKQEKVKVAVMSDNDERLSETMNNLKNFLNAIETHLDIPYTDVEAAEGSDKDIIVTYDNKWAQIPCLISLYFLLLRVGRFYTGELNIEPIVKWLEGVCKGSGIANGDQSMLMGIGKSGKLTRLLIKKDFPNQKWEDYTSVSMVHSYSGIVSVKYDVEKGGVNVYF